MCGIAGFVHLDPRGLPAAAERLTWIEAMTRSMIHRGPDGFGHALVGPATLGHRRLAVIDLVSGSQPMTHAGTGATITFNGEIYNFGAIKTRLESRGHVFRTSSDTEVLLAAWVESGPDCLTELEGMFAFAIFDPRTNALFAARDRFGKKPFYYTQQHGVLAFASELTALTRLPFCDFSVSTRTLARFLTYEYVPTPESIYREVRKLEPGRFLILKDGRVTIEPYWDLPLPDPYPGHASEDDVCEELRFHLTRAVKRRLVSDVPLGVLLSGGIDSSSVTAVMAGLVPKAKTFSIGFTEKSYDESPYARAVAEKYRTDHYEHILSAERCGELLPGIVERLDEPLADPSIVPTFFLSEVTRRHVTVALGGEGPDELFAGYEQYIGFKIARAYLALPALLRTGLIEPLSRWLPESTNYINAGLVARTFLAGTRMPESLRVQTWLSAFTSDVQRSLWRKPAEDFLAPPTLLAPTARLFDGFAATDPLAKVVYAFARQYMLDDILMKVDRCSMMHSLEVRAPFLDRDLAEFTCRLPMRLRIRGSKRKYILKKAVAGLLPSQIINRPKRGFIIPTAQWLKNSLRPCLEELTGDPWIVDQGLFNAKTLRALREEHYAGQKDHRKELWTMLVLQLWLKKNRPKIVEEP